MIASFPHKMCTKRTVSVIGWASRYARIVSPERPASTGSSFSLSRLSCIGEHHLSIVEVNAGNGGQGEDCRGEHIHKTQGRIVGHPVPAALRAVLALAEFRLPACSDTLCSRRDMQRLWLPEVGGVYGATGPGRAGSTMTISHNLSHPGDLQFLREP